MFPDLLDRAVQYSYLYRLGFLFFLREKNNNKKKDFGAKLVLPTTLQQVDLAFPSQRPDDAFPSKSGVFF